MAIVGEMATVYIRTILKHLFWDKSKVGLIDKLTVNKVYKMRPMYTITEKILILCKHFCRELDVKKLQINFVLNIKR